jgi:hypothetical protein
MWGVVVASLHHPFGWSFEVASCLPVSVMRQRLLAHTQVIATIITLTSSVA